MLADLRQKQLLTYLVTRRAAQISELSMAFGVSMSTVRRDLQEMEDRGLVRRVHGGALLLDGHPDRGAEETAPQRASHQAEVKRRIGQAAAALVRDNSTIIVTGGTTTAEMLPFLAEKANLTVITNAVNVAYALSGGPSIDVIVLGGWLRHSELSLLGHLTMQALHDLRADQVFHGIFGIDVEHGLTGTFIQEVQTDRAIIGAARELVILADHTKFGQTGPMRLLPIGAASTVVTDTEAPASSVEALRRQGINVIVV
jgi:DeoR/GlpR family transcriptional regulator of sugar metabolism